MSSQTPNLNLVLPVGTEKVSRQIINDNNTKIDTAVGANSTAIAKWSTRHSAVDLGTLTSLSALQSALKTLADALALYETKFFYATINFSGTFEYYNTVYTGEITYITPDRYNVLMQNHTNASQIYRGACASGTWSWAQLVTKTNHLRTLTSLFEFTGTSGQQITVSGSKNIDEYTLLHFDLYDTNGNIIASLCASPLMLRGIVTHYVYGASTSIWGSFSFINGTKNLTVNRTSATTSKFRCYGID